MQTVVAQSHPVGPEQGVGAEGARPGPGVTKTMTPSGVEQLFYDQLFANNPE